MAEGTAPRPIGVGDIAISFESGVTNQNEAITKCRNCANVYNINLSVTVTKSASTGWYKIASIPYMYAPNYSLFTLSEHFGVLSGEAQISSDGGIYIDHSNAESQYIVRINATWIK